ncbi:hypothetical protein PITCH_A640001 [uncultured Desulfobacterium sp.]|uniref:Uncharacterized protein n=1 Tax=uncultured Desulfobacterium sp. TaxID=201089 RepID=A0A445N131_9BACT|nr:hypothetical protein PITCH_A640001 [uncultured Desulfobacterium sp.]
MNRVMFGIAGNREVALQTIVYARHGRELICESSLYVNPVNVLNILIKIPAGGKGNMRVDI